MSWLTRKPTQTAPVPTQETAQQSDERTRGHDLNNKLNTASLMVEDADRRVNHIRAEVLLRGRKHGPDSGLHL